MKTAPMRGGTPRTDDAYAIKREPIPMDLRVPMFVTPETTCDSSLPAIDRDLYGASLSAPDLTIYIRNGYFIAHGHYRGVEFRVQTSANLRDLIHYLARRANDIDKEVGAIRIKPKKKHKY